MTKKTCIISSGRSGTQLLLRSLCSHPQILDNKSPEPFGYLLNSFEYYTPFIKSAFGIKDDDLLLATRYFSKCDMYKYLDHIFENEDLVKILYWQATEYVLEYLVKHLDILIIHLVRQDIVNSYISTVKLDRLLENIEDKIWIDVKEASDHIDFWLDQKACVDEMFKDRQICITYEGLIADWESTMAMLFSNMSVDPYDAPMVVSREKTTPIDSYIENPDAISELRAKYAFFAKNRLTEPLYGV